MKIRVTGYSHTYPLGASGQFEKAWIEADFEEGDDIQANLHFLKREVEQFHKESNPNSIITVTSVKVVDDNKSPEEKMVEQINEINDLTILKSFELLASRNEKIKSAYDNRLKQLTA